MRTGSRLDRPREGRAGAARLDAVARFEDGEAARTNLRAPRMYTHVACTGPRLRTRLNGQHDLLQGRRTIPAVLHRP